MREPVVLEGARERLQGRINDALAKTGLNARQAVAQMLKQHESMKDSLVDSQDVFFTPNEEGPGIFMGFVHVDDKDQYSVMADLHDNAITQAAAKYSVPTKYLKDLARSRFHWERQLATRILRTHFEREEPQELLVRRVGDQARAVLSSSYKRMQMAPIFAEFASRAAEAGAVPYDGHLSDLKGYMEVIIPEVIEIDTINNDKVYQVFGARIESSDFGQGALAVKDFTVQAICTNGMIGQVIQKEIHLGQKIDKNVRIANDTMEAVTQAGKLMARDSVRHLLGTERKQLMIKRIQRASERVIEDPVKFVTKELPQIGMSKEEADLVNQFLMGDSAADGVVGAPTIWKISQAVTAVARNFEPTRMRELQEIGGTLVFGSR